MEPFFSKRTRKTGFSIGLGLSIVVASSILYRDARYEKIMQEEGVRAVLPVDQEIQKLETLLERSIPYDHLMATIKADPEKALATYADQLTELERLRQQRKLLLVEHPNLATQLKDKAGLEAVVPLFYMMGIPTTLLLLGCAQSFYAVRKNRREKRR